ncbi:MAG: tRNA1(Val) (adenine(37)-N6)-methyltransferase [Bacilli bacterium]|nr:tRNA1(Val) (adenine(37)-N6)-methyltransferase [Bacilli bacterium]
MFKFSLDSVLLANFVTINKKINKILDIGTGNAVIPLIITTKTKCLIDAIEIQKKAYDLAIKSVNYNKLEDQIRIINQDVNDYSNECQTEIYDIITCNPPFFKTTNEAHLNNNDFKSIARHEINLDLERLFKISKKLLKNNGIISIVHRPERLIDIITIMKKNNIEPKKMQLVYPKKNKEANILLIEGRKNGNAGLKILEPLFVHDEDGNYSEQVIKYFE